jgi:hypothetical protein
MLVSARYNVGEVACWALKMSKNNLSLTLIYQPEDSSFISKNIGKVYADSS